MFCPNCKCEFEGWTDKCPDCHIPLVAELPPTSQRAAEAIPYQALVELVKESGGQISVEILATDIATEKKWGFPHLGYGYAWTRHMRGFQENLQAELSTVEVGKSRGWSFPYFAYGFAWEKRMEGVIGGNQITLEVTKVQRERKWRFPYLGYGYAWAESMSGRCGEQLKADLQTTQVGKRREWGFPYFSFGFAWINKAVLTISSV